MEKIVTKKEVLEEAINTLTKTQYRLEIDAELAEEKLKSLDLKDFNNNIVEYTKNRDKVREEIKKIKKGIEEVKELLKSLRKIYDKNK